MDCWVHTLIKYQTNTHVVFSNHTMLLVDIYIHFKPHIHTTSLSLSHTPAHRPPMYSKTSFKTSSRPFEKEVALLTQLPLWTCPHFERHHPPRY